MVLRIQDCWMPKKSKSWDTLNNDGYCTQNGTDWFYNLVVDPKNAGGMRNIEEHD